ncbi:PDZ domain-containing protein [Cohnella pontilimi]|uniref:PDZ domain-containing protein n=1 Tax=Cohnella pontilimi TaxID=2564100 RepID=A0A4U0FF57_9BACL|nr:PDZ domain-containing protein [Cohnella pontilimi]TJY41982.1 PDZ domain-containing protein [Cohnella pontilimi]
MDSLLVVLQEAGNAALGLLSLPYFYIAVLLAWWHARQASKLQRRLFHVRLHSSVTVALWRTGAGVLAGIGLSLIGLAAGAELTAGTLLFVWIATFVLALFRLRYICLAYAAGALGILQAVLSVTVSESNLHGFALDAVQTLNDINVPGLLFLAGLLHVAEGLLVRLQGAKTAVPLFLEGKRGKPVGGFAISGLWPVPLLWLVPASGGFELPWTPLFGIGGDIGSWSLMAFPVLIGFNDRTETYWPEQKSAQSGYALMIYGAVLSGLAAGAAFWSPLAVVASVAAFALHEGLLLFSRSRERGRLPLYVQDGTGVRVLAVLPGTPAAEMGLVAGELIRKVNGAATRNKKELHAALQRQAAFSKMEVVNREGHVKFVQRARYAGEHHMLGLVLAPDEEADFVAAPRSASLWQGLARRRRDAVAPAAEEALAAETEMAASVEIAEEDEPLELSDEDLEPVHAADELPQDPGLPPRRSKSR